MISSLKKYPWATYLLVIINVIVFAVIELSGDSTRSIYDLLDWGANFTPYTFKNEWWRLITSMFLHIGIIHLAVNMFSLYSLGRFVEMAFGHRVFLITYFVAGLAAGLASSYFNLYVVSAGASGAIFGIYGFYIVQVLAHSWHDKKAVLKSFISFAAYVLVITLIGTKANFDNYAHMGGLAAGLLIALLDVAFNRYRTHRIYPAVLVGSLLLIALAYIKMPRLKVQYFDTFQTFLQADKQTVETMKRNYSSDSAMANEMSRLIMKWDTVKYQTDTLPPLPEALEHDRAILDHYTGLKQSELGYIVTSIREESYVYMDSLDIVRQQMDSMPALNYVLNYNRPQPEEPDTARQQPPRGELAKVYYDSLWKKCEPWEYVYFRVGYKDSLGRWNGPVRDYYKSGKIQMKGKYSADLKDGVFLYYNENNTYSAAGRFEKDYKVGKWQYFYDNGMLQSEVRYQDWAYTINTWDSTGHPMVVKGSGEDIQKYRNGIVASYAKYVEGRVEGESYGYHRDGRPYFKEYYHNGRLVSGRAVSASGEKHDYDISTFIPHPEGGNRAFQAYLEQHKVYPPEAGKHHVSGDLELIGTVYEDGNVGDIRALNRLGYGCEEEAERLLMNGPKWIPAYIHGVEPVTSETKVVISFP